jgi:uncharacterized protein
MPNEPVSASKVNLAVHYVLFYDVVEGYVAKREPFRNLHIQLVQQSYARGELVLAGALADPPDGAVLIFRGPAPDAAEAFVKADPYVQNGLIAKWRIRKWMAVVPDGQQRA